MSYSTRRDAAALQARSEADRRAYHRFELPHGQLVVEVGSEGLYATRVEVQDISLGGVKLCVDEVASWAGTRHCVVRFLDEAKGVRPAAIRGKIRRTGEEEGDPFVAIEFAEPLEELALSA